MLMSIKLTRRRKATTGASFWMMEAWQGTAKSPLKLGQFHCGKCSTLPLRTDEAHHSAREIGRARHKEGALMSGPEIGLIGDIGATNARFALVQPDGSATPARVYALDDYPSLDVLASA
jgi:hypothetical protein